MVRTVDGCRPNATELSIQPQRGPRPSCQFLFSFSFFVVIFTSLSFAFVPCFCRLFLVLCFWSFVFVACFCRLFLSLVICVILFYHFIIFSLCFFLSLYGICVGYLFFFCCLLC